MFRLSFVFASVLVISEAFAVDVQDVLSLWGSQEGTWTGHIEIYGPDSSAPQTVALTTRWDSVPDHSIITKVETFTGSKGETSAVTVMFADSRPGDIVTPYFTNGQQRDYHFSVVSVSVTDATHWTTVVATPGKQEIYESRPAELRYVRTRNGDIIENTKDVKFLDGDPNSAWERRSFIRQTLSP